MKNMTLTNILNVCNGLFKSPAHLDVSFSDICDIEVSGITIDSRNITSNCLFVALVGARVDGHDYIAQTIDAGALCALSECDLGAVDFPYILVDSTHQALKDMAAFYRQSLEIKVVGVTGSVGKTSTKEMIASVLEQKYNVLKTAGNYNNEIGLPLTIFNLREEHEVAILEMGISEFGEMSRLSAVAKPDLAVITNIGSCHLEFLNDLDGVLAAKSEIFESMSPDACVILNGMDTQLCKITSVHGKKPLFFGMDTPSPVDKAITASEILSLGMDGSHCKLSWDSESITPTISLPGNHMVLNAMASALVGLELGLSGSEICTGIEALLPVSGRNNLISGPRYQVIDDCYNANPISMKASLDVLHLSKDRKVAILGDMGELGTNEILMHNEVGAYAASLDLDVLVCIGPLAKHMAQGASTFLKDKMILTDGENTPSNDSGKRLHILHFETKEAFLKSYGDILNTGDVILLKSSNFMKFGEILDELIR